MKVAYADPPYLGSAVRHYAHQHVDASDYDQLAAHEALIQRLTTEFDGWALSCTSGNLRDLLPLTPRSARVMAWVKPFASYKPGVTVAYAWEPIIVQPARTLPRTEPTERDWVSANITLKKGTSGAKPREFSMWLFRVLGLQPDDEFVDLFPGSAAVQTAYQEWLGEPQATPLFKEGVV